MPQNIRLFSDVGAKMSMFDNKAKEHKQSQMINPFSDWDGSGTRRKLSRDDPDYGKPVAGSKTAERGRQAQLQMISDMVELCDLIFDCGMRSPDGRGAICFGDVFRLYSQINDKCVGLLMRGRKHNILDFEGEMLFQRRDDDKMIELLLPLNTIRYKYGMPERAGCGEVRPDLLEELERQLREKQPARSRSMEQLGLPPPQLHKSRSMELDRDAARGDHGWQLTPEAPDAAGRMGRSAENLTQIVEDEGAVGGVFTAVPEGAVGGATDEATKDVSVGGRDTMVDSERGEEAVSGEVQVKWELNSDDDEEENVAELQGRTTETAPVTWPDVKIVVEEDVDLEADVSMNDGQAKESNEEKGASDEEVKENEIVHMTVGGASDQASLSDAASLAPESEADIDFWANTEQDFGSSADDNDNSGMKSAVQTPRVETPERAPSPSPSEADRTVEGPTTTDDDLHTEDILEENATGGIDKQSDDGSDKATSDQPETEQHVFSFWDVTDKDEKTPEDAKDGEPFTSLGETSPPERHIDKDDGFSFWDGVESDGTFEKVPSQHAEKDGGFSFGDAAKDGEPSEKAPEAGEAESTSGETANDCNEHTVIHNGAEEETCTTGNVTDSKDLDESGCSTVAVAEGTDNDVPATNGEVFSFWDVSDEETEHTPAFRRSKTDRWNDDTAETPVISKATADSPDEATSVDSACCGRVPSPTEQWDASSAEHPCQEDRVRVSQRPVTAPPHISPSDDSEPVPAR